MVSEIEIRLALIQKFPRLSGSSFALTSKQTPTYNCIAWAASKDHRIWWPNLGYWPIGCPKSDALSAFQKAFRAVGYESSSNGDLENGRIKVAFYGNNEGVLHAARQLPSGKWTSKLGPFVDMSHDLEALQGEEYGSLLGFMSRDV